MIWIGVAVYHEEDIVTTISAANSQDPAPRLRLFAFEKSEKKRVTSLKAFCQHQLLLFRSKKKQNKLLFFFFFFFLTRELLRIPDTCTETKTSWRVRQEDWTNRAREDSFQQRTFTQIFFQSWQPEGSAY